MAKKQCPNCGKFINDTETDCPKCGAFVYTRKIQNLETEELFKEENGREYQKSIFDEENKQNQIISFGKLFASIATFCAIIGLFGNPVLSMFALILVRFATKFSKDNSAKTLLKIAGILGGIGLIIGVVLEILGMPFNDFLIYEMTKFFETT